MILFFKLQTGFAFCGLGLHISRQSVERNEMFLTIGLLMTIDDRVMSKVMLKYKISNFGSCFGIYSCLDWQTLGKFDEA